MHGIMVPSAAASLVASLLVTLGAAKPCFNQTISRDVVIVGGGASGAHAAVRLRDQNYTVAVVEKRDVLGGHTSKYTDPATGKVLNIGVQAWMDYGTIKDFIHRMGVDTDGSMQFTTLTTNYVDMQTGAPVDGYTAPADADMYAALQRYVDVLEQYDSLMMPGFTKFPAAAADIPEDLTMPFGDFVAKYDLAAAVPQLWSSTVMGLGDAMRVPALYVIAASPLPMAKALLGQAAAIVPSTGCLWDLYENITALLGDDVLYSSTVVGSTREEGKDVVLTVKNSIDGSVTKITAKRLLVAVEPTPENLAPFAPDATEKDVFDKFEFTTTFAGVVRHPALKISNGYTNTDPAAASNNYTVYPLPAQVGTVNYIGGTKDLFQLTAVGTEATTGADMQALIGQSIDNLMASGVLDAAAGTQDAAAPSFPAFASHGLMHSRVSGDDLRGGFITRQNALQGYRNTWYTGAAFSMGMSTVIWEFNEELLPRVVEGI